MKNSKIMDTPGSQTGCNRCGNCCNEGGPAFHLHDLPLLTAGKIPLAHLITVRRGELASSPTEKTPTAVEAEFIKLSGRQGHWSCYYYKEGLGCSIYSYRPQACRVLKCWDPAELLALMGRDILSRKDILGEDHPMLAAIAEHESLVPYDFFMFMQAGFDRLTAIEKAEIEARVQRDLQFRGRIVRREGLSVGLELFYFGRPLFQLLRALGIDVRAAGDRVSLRW